MSVEFTPVMVGGEAAVIWFGWDFDGDGEWDWQESDTTLPESFERALSVGAYPWVFAVSNSVGEYACITNGEELVVHPLTYYLRLDGGAIPPYDTEVKAATSFADIVGYAKGGGGIYTTSAAGAIVEACTIVANSCPAAYDGAGIYCGTVALECKNTLVYGNARLDESSSDVAGTLSAFEYCLAPELSGIGQNLAVDPMLVQSENGEWRLHKDSPCRNAGTPQAEAPDWMIGAVDFWGQPRITQRRVDIGAEELLPANGTLLILR